MVRQVVDRDEVRQYVEALRDQLDAPQLREKAAQAADTLEGKGDPVEKLREALPPVTEKLASSGADAADVQTFARIPEVALHRERTTRKSRRRIGLAALEHANAPARLGKAGGRHRATEPRANDDRVEMPGSATHR